MKNIAILGGSFDPPHIGHLQTALAVQKEFIFDRFLFLPCKKPVLKKQSVATTEQRLTMLKLLLQPYPFFEIDQREIKRPTPSYMVETLQSLRDELGNNTVITLIIGMDAFLQLPQWHQWEKILHLSNLLVMNREVNHKNIPESLQALLSTHEVKGKSTLKNHTQGKIIFFNAGEYPISSTLIRERIQQNLPVREYLSEAVAAYIKQQGLYQSISLGYPPT